MQSLILVGLRGVGKTVLLNKLGDVAEKANFRSTTVEATEGKSLPELLVPHLRTILYSLSTIESAKEKARRGLRALKGFLNGLRVKIGDIDVGLSVDAEQTLNDYLNFPISALSAETTPSQLLRILPSKRG